MSQPRNVRTIRVVLAACAAFVAVVLPDLAALRDHAGPAIHPAESLLPAPAPTVDVAGIALARELAHQRLKALGLSGAQITPVLDKVLAGAPAERVDRDLVTLLPPGPREEAGQVTRLLSTLVERGGPLGTTEHLVWTFGMADVFGLGIERGVGERRLYSVGGTGGVDPGSPDTGAPVDEPLTPSTGGTCLTCPNVDSGPYDPDFFWQGIDGSILPAGDCAWYSFNVVTGITYDFKTCDPEGFATFDTNLDAYDPTSGAPCSFKASNDDCFGVGPASLLTWTATYTGVVNVRVRGVPGGPGAPGGDFRLAYRKTCPTSSSCSAPDGVLSPPLVACQYQMGVLDPCSGSRYFTVPLSHDQTYTFTLCPGTCPSAFASFDSALELYQGAGIVASDSGACGDDAEITFFSTIDGTFCVHVLSEGGSTDDFSLGYRVACQAPSAVDVLPTESSTNQPDCTKLQRFTVTTGGTAEFTVDWAITPLPGNTATPPAGTFTTTSSTASFDTTLQGDGAYTVTVIVSNECGSETRTITFDLLDRASPTVTAIAEAATCTSFAPRRINPPSSLSVPTRPPSNVDVDAIRRVMFASTDPREVEENIARKLGVQAKSVRVIDSFDPRYSTPPGAMAVSCPTPCTVGNLSQLTNDYYEVFLSCSNGAFTARTGRLHPVTISSGSGQNVIYGGAGGSPSTSDVTFHVFETNDNFLDPAGGSTCLFTPAANPSEPDAAGIESEWTRSLTNGTHLTMREEIVAFGDAVDNSGIRLTLGATNDSGPPVTMGVRWQIDYQNASDDGPHYAQVHCTPFEIFNSRSTEHEFSPAEIDDQDFFRIQNNTGSPIFGNYTGTAEMFGHDGTGKPDRLVYGYWGRMNGAPWDYVTVEGDTSPDADSAVLYYFGYTAADGIVVGPGDTFVRSVIIFTSGDSTDCGAFRPGSCEPAAVTICPGDCARIGATGVDNCGPVTINLIDSSPGAPTCGSYPCVVDFPVAGVYTYTWEGTDGAGNRQECTSTVTVRDDGTCNRPPTCSAGGPYFAACRQADIDGAGVDDPDGDEILYTWTSDRPDVTVSPASGVVPGGGGARGVPASVATLDADTPPCGVVATLTLTIDDQHGETSSCSTTVTFDDITEPSGGTGSGTVIACLWPPNHWYVPVNVSDLGASGGFDDCTSVTWRLVGCSSDQPDDARESDPTSEWNGDGHTTDDCALSPDGSTLYVRSERCGTGPTAQDGRHYGVLAVLTDECGNASAPIVVGTVHVPHDQSPHERPCLDPTEIGMRDLP